MANKLKNIIVFFVGIVLIVCGSFLKSGYAPIGWVLIGVGLFISAFGLVSYIISGRKTLDSENEPPEKEKPEYRRKKTILTRAEWEFLQVLKGCINLDKYDIDVQVPLVAVIDKLTQNSYRNELFRVVDFLIVDAVTYAPLLLVELNDASHNRPERAERDRKVIEICERAGMPLVGFSPQQARDVAYIKKTVQKSMLKK